MGIYHRLRRKIQFRVTILRGAAKRFFEGLPLISTPAMSAGIPDRDEDFFIARMGAVFAFERALTEIEIRFTQQKIDVATRSIEALSEAGGELLATKLRGLGELQTVMKILNGHLRNLRERLSKFRDLPREILRMQYREIMSTPGLVAMRIRNRRMVYRTETLYGQDHQMRWRRIGKFQISFDLINPSLQSFQWLNLDGTRKSVFPNGGSATLHGPPNIEDGEGCVGYVRCAGNAAHSFIWGGAKDRDYPTLVAFSIRYPECAGSLSAKAMESWPEVHEADVPQWYFEQRG